MEFFEKIREKVEKWALARRNITYTRIRPVLTDGRALLRVDKKEERWRDF
jgi:hypothetical protein